MSFVIIVAFILSSGLPILGTIEGKKELKRDIIINCKSNQHVKTCLRKLEGLDGSRTTR